jgi:sulfatase maturation enzyme AslB (radical SAM superfamily)
MNKSTSCPALWSHLHVINDGRAFPCCMTPIEDANSFGNVNQLSLIEIMNSPKAKSMRADMLVGKPLPASCHRCTEKEALGMNSYRSGWVDDYTDLIAERVADTLPDGTIDRVELNSWDFRFSNYCNLSCRTCAPLFSTSWDKDFKMLWGKSSNEKVLINLENAVPFWKDLEDQVKHVQTIHFAGGEPIIMEEHWRLMDMLIERGMTDIELNYSTNATVLKFKGRNVLDLWKKFKRVHLSLSIDGEGATFDYVRNRGKWSETEQNLLDIKSAGIKHWIHPTISVLNIFRLTELHDRMIELGLVNTNNIKNYFISEFHLNPLFTPDYYCLTSLPTQHKKAVTIMLEDYSDKMYDLYKIPKDGWLSIINFMNTSDTSHLWNKFIDITKRLDTIRKQDFLKINPEFKNDFI